MAFVEHDGARLSYEVTGDGPPVLFIQGTGVVGNGWRPQVEALSERFRCASFDNRGIGASTLGEGRLTIERMAEDAVAVMDALGWDAAHVVGHSMGGLVAQQLALAHRDRVSSLALLCTIARGRQAVKVTPRVLWMALAMKLGTRRVRRRAFLSNVLPPAELAARDIDELAESLAPFFGHDPGTQPPVVMKQVMMMRRFDVSARLGELSGLRTLVMSSEQDRIARPEYGRELAARIPGATYVELEGAAHGVPLTQPDRVNELLSQHLGALGKTDAPAAN